MANSRHVFFLCLLLLLSISGSLISKNVIVKDKLFTADEIRGMKILLSHEEAIWSFQQRRESGIDLSENYDRAERSPASCYSWSINLTPASFMGSSAWSKLAKTLSSNFSAHANNSDCSILAIEGQIYTKVSHICSRRFSLNNTDINSFVAVIFLVDNWQRNSYGELVVYDKGEILKAVHPKPGRLVIFPASLEHVNKPPAIDLSGRLYVIKVYILMSDDKGQINIEPRKESYVSQQVPSFKLLSKAEAAPRVDIRQFMTRNFTTTDGRSIVVFDDIIPAKELDALMRTVKSSGYNDNAAGVNSTDNVQWIMAFEVDEFVETFMWQLFSQIVTTVAGKEGYYPYDIGCNNIQSSDTTTIHTDCGPYENEFTLLVYLNQNWTENDHGETVFFSDMDGSEVIFAVRPKYGRVIIFHGTIPHSARPPPLTFSGMTFR